MSLVKEIQKVHDFLYKEIGDTKILLPLMLTILDKYKEKKKLGSTSLINDLKSELYRLDRRMMEQTLQKISKQHSNLNPLLERLINDSLNAISPDRLPNAKIEKAKQRIINANDFLKGLEKEEDFIGILFETLAAHSGVFDKTDGRFFTPKNIILIVVEIVGSLFEKNSVKSFNLSVCDPCCGSARYLVHWVNRLKREYGLSDEKTQEIYSNKLFGIDISLDVASWAAWNMIFHGDGAANIENADSLNWYGLLVYWNLIQRLLEELPEKINELKKTYRQRDVLGVIDHIEEISNTVLKLKGKYEIDLESEDVKKLYVLLNELIDLYHKLNFEWDTLEKLSRKREFKSIAEIIKLNWLRKHPEIKSGFDLVITNPPFGRGSQDLMITDPFILCQYKLATELWLGDASKSIIENLLKKQFGNIVDFYKRCIREIGHNDSNIEQKLKKIEDDYLENKKVKFEHLSVSILKKIAEKYKLSIKNTKKDKIVDLIKNTLGRDSLNEEELSIVPHELKQKIENQAQNKLEEKIISLAYEYLYEKQGNNYKVSEFLYEKIKNKLGREWITIEDVYDYSEKLIIKDSAAGDEHTIYHDNKGEPLLFKDALPKQVVFLEEFLRYVKEEGYVFTVVDTGVLSNSEDEYVRRFLYRNSRIYAIVEFPHNGFKAAGTGVKTAVILYQKKKNPPEDYEIFGSLPQHLGYILNKQDTPPDPDHNDLGKVLCDWRNHIGLGMMCDPCKDSNVEEKECCDWYKNGYCPVWRYEIEKADL